ncbi:histone acetylation protein-domain-containing protein [Melampsora americana]|nr:histone acetylation protein-domain-containing protein [Melampsora americana]
MINTENKDHPKDNYEAKEIKEVKTKSNSIDQTKIKTSKHPSLHQFLLKSISTFKTKPNSSRKLILTTLKSKPYHTHTLFPHSTNPNQSNLKIDYLILLSEKLQNYLKKDDDDDQSNSMITVPIFAIEASLYLISTTSIGLLYISKLDSTGLTPFSIPAKVLTQSFISYFFLYSHHHHHRSIKNLRVHVFARAAREGQYLFPGSASNVLGGQGDGAPTSNDKLKNEGSVCPKGKRILDDQQLIKWWKIVLSKPSSPTGITHRFYILPGFDQDESLAILPTSDQDWTYGHPYHTIGSPLKPSSSSSSSSSTESNLLLSDLIPALWDDPKARFLQSLSRSVANPAGEIGDWDDAIQERSSSNLEIDRVRERRCLNLISVDEFWERMGGRQECCDGRVSAFFVISGSTQIDDDDRNSNEELSSVDSTLSTKNQSDSQSSSSNGHISSSVTRNLWVMLWSKFHNCDYSRLESASTGYTAWIEAIQACIPAHGFSKIHSEITVDNPDLESKKRLVECGPVSPKKPAITILQPRKKVKPSI